MKSVTFTSTLTESKDGQAGPMMRRNLHEITNRPAESAGQGSEGSDVPGVESGVSLQRKLKPRPGFLMSGERDALEVVGMSTSLGTTSKSGM